LCFELEFLAHPSLRHVEDQVKAFRFLDLPIELIDDTLGHVILHRDLLNFGLASRSCSSIAIPRHTEYRVVYFLDDDTDTTWSHLAQRLDLTSNIREIYVTYLDAPEEFSGGPSFHCPETLVDQDPKSQSKGVQEVREDMLKALGVMTRLEKVHWNWVPSGSKHIIPRVFEILRTIPTLKHLSFNHPKKLSGKLPPEKHLVRRVFLRSSSLTAS
ncbi:hypothetical protein BDN72DRAFT_147135, partial [Pluteus cervinus]